MNSTELLILHEEMCDKAREIMKKKNADYSGGSTDPFANFRGSLNFGVEPEIGIAVRVGDKFKRVEAYIKNGALAVQDESVIDSITDSINYLVLMAGMIIERQEKNKKAQQLKMIRPEDIGLGQHDYKDKVAEVTGHKPYREGPGDRVGSMED